MRSIRSCSPVSFRRRRRAAARRRIAETIDRLLNGQEQLPALLERRRRRLREAGKPLRSQPEVIVNNALSDRLTVIEVAGRDRPGLLYDLTSALSDLVARYRLGAHHDVRREGRRRLLRDGSHRQADRQRGATERRSGTRLQSILADDDAPRSCQAWPAAKPQQKRRLAVTIRPTGPGTRARNPPARERASAEKCA